MSPVSALTKAWKPGGNALESRIRRRVEKNEREKKIRVEQGMYNLCAEC